MSAAPTRRTDRWTLFSLLVIAGLGAFVLVHVLTKDLFVFTEARGYSLYRPPLDPLRSTRARLGESLRRRSRLPERP